MGGRANRVRVNAAGDGGVQNDESDDSCSALVKVSMAVRAVLMFNISSRGRVQTNRKGGWVVFAFDRDLIFSFITITHPHSAPLPLPVRAAQKAHMLAHAHIFHFTSLKLFSGAPSGGLM